MVLTADQLVGSFISHFAIKQTRDNRIGLLLDKKINSQIYIIGSSRALNNYSPEVISKITGKSCFNMGVSGSNIIFHELVLDLILESAKKPELIIYNIDDFGTLYKMDAVVYRKDVLYPYVDNGTINRSICEQTGKNEIASILMKSYRQNVNFINSLKYLAYGQEATDYKTTNFDKNGANILVQRPEDRIPTFAASRLPDKPKQFDESNVEAFNRIQKKCLDNNIKLLLSLPPLFTYETKGFESEVRSQMVDGVTLVDFTGQLRDSSYFFNRDHMNKKGALVFSEMVGNEINKSAL